MQDFVDHSLIGTVVRLQVTPRRFRSASRIAAAMFAEARRLERVFNRFDPDSELTALREQGVLGGPELTRVLVEAAHWHRRTDGIFDPTGGSGSLPWRVVPGDAVEPVGDTSTVDLNAIAKGWIVARAVEIGIERAETVVVDAGGDVAHRGAGSIRVGIENPLFPYDNVALLATVEVANEAIATSGGSRRGPHLRDPRTGAPPVTVASASVVASDAAAADVLATALAILDPADGLTLADREGVAALVVDARGERHENEAWRGRLLS